MKKSKSTIIILLFMITFSLELFGNGKAGNKFYLSIQDYPETEVKIDGKSINDHIRELFREGLNLDIEEIKSDWRGAKENVAKGEAHAIGLITKSKENNHENIILSEPIFVENVFVVSHKKRLHSVKDLNNENIYYYKYDELGYKLLKEYAEKNDIKVNLIPVEDIENYEDEYYLDSEFTAVKAPNRLLVSYLAPVCIGVHKSHKHLIPKINNLLDIKYRKLLNDYIAQLPVYYQRERFLKSLNDQEKSYLEKIKNITTALEEDIALSIYIESKKKFIGILPTYIDKISSIIGKPIIVKTYFDKTFNDILKDLESGKLDFLTLSVSEKRKQIYNFSEAIDYLPIYLLSNKDSNDYKIGVIQGGKSNDIANKYFEGSEIVEHYSTEDLFAAFENQKVGGVITTFPMYGLNSINYKNIKLEEVPVNFAFNKEHMILRDIFNKAISVITDIDRAEVLIKTEYDQKENLFIIKEKEEKSRLLMLGILIITIPITFVLLLKIIVQRKLNIALKYDQLTKLQNRYLFNEVCGKKDYNRGVVIIIDLDNFKRANDTYGHHIGDLILQEVGRILLEVFPKESSFRISGDEFYIFLEREDYKEKLNLLMNEGESSEVLSKYNIFFSVGYYVKSEKERLEQAFEKADRAMYMAKEKVGFAKQEYVNVVVKEVD